MSDVSGIPNMGIPALSGFNGGGGTNNSGYFQDPGFSLANAFAQRNANNNYFGNQAQTLAAAEIPQAQLYGGGSFGAQPAHYAGVGAAFGRATGGFNAKPAAPAPPTQVPVDSSIFDTAGTDPVPYLNTGGGDPFGGGGFGRMPTAFDTGTQGVPNLSGGGTPFGGGGFGSPPPPYTPNFDAVFDSNFSPANPTIGFSRGRSMPQGAGYDPGASATLPPGPPPSRFDPQRAIDAVNQFSGVGTEPQPSTAPGSNTGGANPFTSGADPITNLGSPFAAGRGFQAAPPSPFEAGAPGIGATLLPAFNRATPGGGVGSLTAPPNFAPSSPFESGGTPFNYAGDYRGSLRNQINQTTIGGGGGFDPSAPPPAREGFGPSSPFVGGAPPVSHQSTASGQAFPVPGIGGYRGNMRDQIAAIMSGSQGMTEPTSGPPLVNGGPNGTSGATSGPTPTQMNDAWRRIGAGPGSPGVSSIAQQTPPPPAPYARINQAIYDIGNVSQPGMFDNLSRPLGQMFSPGQYRGR